MSEEAQAGAAMTIEIVLGIVFGFVLVVIIYNTWRYILPFVLLFFYVILILGIPAIIANYFGFDWWWGSAISAFGIFVWLHVLYDRYTSEREAEIDAELARWNERIIEERRREEEAE